MELTAEEIAAIETMRKTKAEKEERERLAARTSNEKALEIFNKKAQALNILAQNLIAEVSFINSSITRKFERDTAETIFLSNKECVTAKDCGFTEFAPVEIHFSLQGSTITVLLNSTSGNSWDKKTNSYTIENDWAIDTKTYHSDIDKKCAKIVLDRLLKKIDKDTRLNLDAKRKETAKIYIAAKYPSAREICINKSDEYGNYTYKANELAGCHNYTSIKGRISFASNTLEIKDMTFGVNAATYHSDSVLVEYPREQKIKAMEEELKQKIATLNREFANAACKVIME